MITNVEEIKYWIYRTHLYTWRNQQVQAKLITPPPYPWSDMDCGFGFPSPRQNKPYGVNLSLTYQINPKHPHPDDYFDTVGFSIYSKRLVDLMEKFDVKAESFPVTMVDKQGNVQSSLDYFVFHSLEGILDAMDEARSEWAGSTSIGIPRLVLDYSKFEHRSIFKCNHIYVQLMRDDLMREIRRQEITGFDFLALERFRSGKFGPRPDYND